MLDGFGRTIKTRKINVLDWININSHFILLYYKQSPFSDANMDDSQRRVNYKVQLKMFLYEANYYYHRIGQTNNNKGE